MAKLVNHDDKWHENNRTVESLKQAAKGLTGDAKRNAEKAARDLQRSNGD